DALGKDENRAARAEMSGGLLEHRPVSSGIRVAILATMDREGAEQAQERADDRVSEERRLGDRDQPARDEREQEHRIDQGVLVVGSDDERSGFRNVLETDDVDAPVEERQHPADERPD